jgi:hypothetical protein
MTAAARCVSIASMSAWSDSAIDSNRDSTSGSSGVLSAVVAAPEPSSLDGTPVVTAISPDPASSGEAPVVLAEMTSGLSTTSPSWSSRHHRSTLSAGPYRNCAMRHRALRISAERSVRRCPVERNLAAAGVSWSSGRPCAGCGAAGDGADAVQSAPVAVADAVPAAVAAAAAAGRAWSAVWSPGQAL